jgi:hypothetical protein
MLPAEDSNLDHLSQSQACLPGYTNGECHACSREDLNLAPSAYQTDALTDELREPDGRAPGWNRTTDLQFRKLLLSIH